jgi:hypothetical protein
MAGLDDRALDARRLHGCRERREVLARPAMASERALDRAAVPCSGGRACELHGRRSGRVDGSAPALDLVARRLCVGGSAQRVPRQDMALVVFDGDA